MYALQGGLQMQPALPLCPLRRYNPPGIVVEKLKKFPNVVEINRTKEVSPNPDIFPFDTLNYPWNVDNFGPLYVPKKGDKVELNMKT